MNNFKDTINNVVSANDTKNELEKANKAKGRLILAIPITAVASSIVTSIIFIKKYNKLRNEYMSYQDNVERKLDEFEQKTTEAEELKKTIEGGFEEV